ncbi:MAG: NAD(P)H-quinone oxidoreductase [Nitrospirae bacterium GWC2_57_9]|nr:MAG: NAD(P)H-quinone oxidoreductase [Nitrospirae bacterium GWC2_57_9]
MKALYMEELKGISGIRIGDFPAPEISGNEVLVRVKAFSLNHLDLWVISGKYPFPVPVPHIFGSDAAGIVERVGPGVSQVKQGDAVIIYPGLSCRSCEACRSGRENECRDFRLLGVLNHGVSAEYVKVPAENLFRKPEGLSFEEAAGTGITYTTAWNSLVLRAGIRQGDTVLVHSAGSGAGSAVIQVARLFNATIITTVGDDWKVLKARELGAEHVINHRKEDFAEAVKRITNGRLADIAVDHVGAATFAGSLASVKRGGRLVTFGATSGDEVPLSLRQVFGKNITIHGVYVGPKAAVDQYLKLMPGKLRTVVDSVFEFADARKAYEKLVSRQFFGKIVVRV